MHASVVPRPILGENVFSSGAPHEHTHLILRLGISGPGTVAVLFVGRGCEEGMATAWMLKDSLATLQF